MSYIGAQQKVLSGRGTVGRFDEGTSAGKYFYRERITVNGKRKYCYRLLEGVKSLEEAVAIAPEAAIALASEQARTSAPKHARFRKSCIGGTQRQLMAPFLLNKRQRNFYVITRCEEMQKSLQRTPLRTSAEFLKTASPAT